MLRLALPLALLALGACTIATGAPPTPVAVVSGPGVEYPVLDGPRGWAVQVEGQRVPCPERSEVSCSWALRAHLNAEAALDEAQG